MWSNVITGLFTLGGIVVGVLLEPVKAWFGVKARNREQRLARATLLISAATNARHHQVELNNVYRTLASGTHLPHDELQRKTEQLFSDMAELRRAVALLRLHGPDELADAAEQVRRADDKLGDLIGSPGDPGPVIPK